MGKDSINYIKESELLNFVFMEVKKLMPCSTLWETRKRKQGTGLKDLTIGMKFKLEIERGWILSLTNMLKCHQGVWVEQPLQNGWTNHSIFKLLGFESKSEYGSFEFKVSFWINLSPFQNYWNAFYIPVVLCGFIIWFWAVVLWAPSGYPAPMFIWPEFCDVFAHAAAWF